ncbi:hypothetical protein LguiB_028106 [Lonicera macranthoides]
MNGYSINANVVVHIPGAPHPVAVAPLPYFRARSLVFASEGLSVPTYKPTTSGNTVLKAEHSYQENYHSSTQGSSISKSTHLSFLTGYAIGDSYAIKNDYLTLIKRMDDNLEEARICSIYPDAFKGIKQISVIGWGSQIQEGVCMFCGSNSGKRDCYKDVVVELGQELNKGDKDLEQFEEDEAANIARWLKIPTFLPPFSLMEIPRKSRTRRSLMKVVISAALKGRRESLLAHQLHRLRDHYASRSSNSSMDPTNQFFNQVGACARLDHITSGHNSLKKHDCIDKSIRYEEDDHDDDASSDSRYADGQYFYCKDPKASTPRRLFRLVQVVKSCIEEPHTIPALRMSHISLATLV